MRYSNKKLLTSVFTFIASIFLFTSCGTNESPVYKENIINKVSACDNISYNDLQDESLEKTSYFVQKKIKTMLTDNKGTFGYYFIDLITGEEFGYNEDTKFGGASTVKLPINLYVYKLRDKGVLDGNTKLEYRKENYETGTGNMQGEKPGTSYKVIDLQKKSIRISDNIAVNILLTNIMGDDFLNYMSSIIEETPYSWKNQWTPKEMGMIMKEIYEFSNSHEILGEEFINNLESTIYNDRLNRDMPNVRVAHKIGTANGYVNDVGIIYGKHPFVVSVFSKDANDVNDIESNLAKMLYEYEDNI